MSLLLAELRQSPEGVGRSVTRSAFLFLWELVHFFGGAKPKELRGQGLPCVFDSDPLPLWAPVATLNCPLMWSFAVCGHGFPRNSGK